MSRKRKPTTTRMKIDCLLDRVFQQFGEHLKCALSGEPMRPGDNVQFDHTHAVVHGGDHGWRALRPVLAAPHLKKTKRDVSDAAKVDRLKSNRRQRKRKKLIASSRFLSKQVARVA